MDIDTVKADFLKGSRIRGYKLSKTHAQLAGSLVLLMNRKLKKADTFALPKACQALSDTVKGHGFLSKSFHRSGLS